jgi:hypothetical protein
MIPSLSIDVYPVNTLEGTIARKWVKKIEELGEYGHMVNPELIQEVICETRGAMNAAKWSPLYQHKFLVQLRNDLTELSEAHPLTRQFITLLDLELESN